MGRRHTGAHPLSAMRVRWRRGLLPLAWVLLAGSAQAEVFNVDVSITLDASQIDANGPGSWMSGLVAIPTTTFDTKDTLQVNLHFADGAALRLNDATGLAGEGATFLVDGSSLNGGTINHFPALFDFSFALLGAVGDAAHNPVTGGGDSTGFGLLGTTFNQVDSLTASSVSFTGLSFSFSVLKGSDHFPNTSTTAAVSLFGGPGAFSIVPAAPVPEPATGALALAGLAALGGVAARRSRRPA